MEGKEGELGKGPWVLLSQLCEYPADWICRQRKGIRNKTSQR